MWEEVIGGKEFRESIEKGLSMLEGEKGKTKK